MVTARKDESIDPQRLFSAAPFCPACAAKFASATAKCQRSQQTGGSKLLQGQIEEEAATGKSGLWLESVSEDFLSLPQARPCLPGAQAEAEPEGESFVWERDGAAGATL